MLTAALVAYFTVCFLVGLRVSVIVAWREAERRLYNSNDVPAQMHWWREPTPLFTLILVTGAAPLLVLWLVSRKVKHLGLTRPPKEIRQKQDKLRRAELERELEL